MRMSVYRPTVLVVLVDADTLK